MNNRRIKKVLIALDYDPTALNVADAGFTFAKEMGAEVILLHVFLNLMNYSLTYLKMEPLKTESVKDLKIASQNFIHKPKFNDQNNMIHTVVKQGDFAISLLNAAKEMAVDIIVMGSHSSMWLEEIVMGRVTNEVLQQTVIPLLIIPTRKHDKSNTFIALGDGSIATKQAMEKLS